MKRALFLLVALSASALEGPARALSEEQQAVGISVASVGAVGGLVTSIAAIVYATRGRAFDTPWVVASLFSAALCVANAITAGTSDIDGAVPIAIGVGAVGAWPLAYTIRSALSEAAPGELFDPPPSEAAPLPRRSSFDFGRPPLPMGIPILTLEL